MLGGANAQTVNFANVCFVYVKRSFLEGHVHLADGADLETTWVLCPGKLVAGSSNLRAHRPCHPLRCPADLASSRTDPRRGHEDPGQDLKAPPVNCSPTVVYAAAPFGLNRTLTYIRILYTRIYGSAVRGLDSSCGGSPPTHAHRSSPHLCSTCTLATSHWYRQEGY